MTSLRTAVAAVLSTLGSFLVASASGCGSDAVGVDACRDIERARCEAGQHCGFVDDVEECKRFYRDQCLHGLKSGKEPGDIALDTCLDAIKQAGACAAAGTQHLADCAGWNVATTVTTPCDAIRFPEQLAACEFLLGPIEASVPTKDVATEAAPADAASEAASDGAADALGGG